MEVWVKYALVAAVFLSIKNIISKNLSGKYKYKDYLIYAISFSFIGIWSYVFITGYTPKKIENTDILMILFRVAIVYAIIDPSIYNAFKNCNNPGEASSIINIETILTFGISVIFLNAKCDFKSIGGILLMLTGAFIVGYK
jgi:uncharacterized membrane protein